MNRPFLLLAAAALVLYARQARASKVVAYQDETGDTLYYGAVDNDPFLNVVNDMLDKAEDTVGATIGAGTRGERNNNPGNIRLTVTKWQGQIDGTDTAFVTFASPEYGIRALARLLENYIEHGYDTVREIINRYAPSSENNTRAYITAVCQTTGFTPDQPLTVMAIPALVPAIIKHENGRIIYSQAQINAGLSLAGVA